MRAIGGIGAAVAAAAALIAAGSSHAGNSRQSLGAPPPQLIAAASRVPAPDFSRPVISGRGSSGLAMFTGRVVVLAFWSSWCAPCRSELRQLQAASRKSPAAAFLGVDVDDTPAEATRTLARAGVSFPNVSDPGAGVAEAFRIAGTPTIVVIDAHGRIAATAEGPLTADAVLRLAQQVASSQSPAAMSTALTRDGRMVTTTRSW